MTNPALLSDTEVANILKCSITELPRRQQAGEIECVQLRDRQLYRLVKSQPNRPHHPATPTPPPSQKETPPSHHSINNESLIKQYEDRGKIIQLLEKNHSLHLHKLFASIKRLRQHRLALVITLEILCGAGIIAATLAHDKINDSRSQSADLYLMSQHDKQQYTQIQQDQQEMDQQYRKITDRFKAGQLEQARLETRLAIQDVKISEARKMITRLVEAVEFSGEKMAKDSTYR